MRLIEIQVVRHQPYEFLRQRRTWSTQNIITIKIYFASIYKIIKGDIQKGQNIWKTIRRLYVIF